MVKRRVSQIKAGALITYFSIAFNILAGLIYTPWMISQIGKSDYGIYTLANSIISLFLIDFGMSSATSVFVAKYKEDNDEAGLQRFLSAIYKLYIIIDAVILAVLIVVFFSLEGIYQNLTPGEIERLKVVFCIAGLYSIVSFPCLTFNGILTAYEKFIPLKVADLIQRVGCVLLTVFALLMGMGLYALVMAQAVFGLVSIVIKVRYVWRSVKFKFVKSPMPIYKDILSYSAWNTVWALAQRLIFNITPTIIGITVAAAADSIAVFGIVTTVEGYFFTIVTAINGMFLSRVTRIIKDDPDGEKITSLAIRVGRFQFALNGLIFVGFLLVGKEFIFLWMGEEYISAYYGILLVVGPGLFLNSLQIAQTTMLAKGLIKYPACVQIVAGVTNIALSFFFSSRWGVIGACISICIAYFVRLAITLIIIKKKLEIDLKKFSWECYFRMSVPAIVSGAASAFAVKFIEGNTWVLLGVKGIIVTAVYLFAVFLFGLRRGEQNSVLLKLHLRKSKNQ